MKKLIWLILVLILAVSAWMFWGDSSSLPKLPTPGTEEVSGEITSFYLSKPNLVVETRKLESVSLYATPADRSVEDFVLGEAVLVEQYGQRQTWALEIPKAQLIRKIYVIGADSEGLTTERVVFPIAGIKDIHESLWGEVPEEIRSLGIGESTSVLGNEITFQSVLEDSRCPVTADCIHAGRLAVGLDVNGSEYVLSSNEEELHAGNLFIKIQKVLPEATEERTDQKDYVVSFSIIYEE